MAERETTSPARLIGLVLVRLVVPLWVAVGATFKLIEATPTTLPKNILVFADKVGFNLFVVLATLITLEFVAVAAMFFLARFARSMAVFMLAAFVLILIGEIAVGNTSCGCFGKVSPSPWVMLAIDGVLLLAVLFTAMRGKAPEMPKGGAFLAAAILVAVTGGASFYRLVIDRAPPQNGDDTSNDNGDEQTPPDNGGAQVPLAANGCPEVTTNPSPSAPEGTYWFVQESEVEGWVGNPWCEANVFQYMHEWPADMNEGKIHVIFYRRTCDHCEEMFWNDLSGDLDVRVAVCEVPETREALRGENPWDMPETPNVVHLQHYPLGWDYYLTSPMIVTIEDGVVTCAQQGGHEDCFDK